MGGWRGRSFDYLHVFTSSQDIIPLLYSDLTEEITPLLNNPESDFVPYRYVTYRFIR